jgi:AbiV family abortive infection protein
MASNEVQEKLLKEAVQACLSNAEQYLKDAEILFENGSYGHSFALTVLGEEELSKAYIYHMCSEELLPLDLIKKLGRFRGSHRRKQTIAATITFTRGITQFFENLIESSKREAEGNRNKSLKIAKKKLQETTEYLKKNKDELGSRMLQFFNKFATLEEDKHKGMYVDAKIEEGVLTSPQSQEKDTVKEELSQFRKMLEFLKPVLMINLSPSERKKLKAQLREAGILQGFLDAIK